MPTNANAYNSRLTDEALEKRFRDTFRSQGGAELVDDLYASGVIVPVVDFTQAAEGSQLPQNLQTAWDISTGSIQIATTTYTAIVSTAGFWQVDLSHSGYNEIVGKQSAVIRIAGGGSLKPIWARTPSNNGTGQTFSTTIEDKFVVFLRPGDVLQGKCMYGNQDILDIWYRQIATVDGDLVNPSGFTSS